MTGVAGEPGALVIVVPTRGRPQAVGRLVDAWHRTAAFVNGAHLHFAIDADDVEAPAYLRNLRAAADSTAYYHLPPAPVKWSPEPESLADLALPAPQRVVPVTWSTVERWAPMVTKLDIAAAAIAGVESGPTIPVPYAVGFAGDDHLPRTSGWARQYLEALRRPGVGIVSCPDGLRTDQLPTQWAMRASIVREWQRMVPADVEHLYCDNAIGQVMNAGLGRWLPDVLIEHVHPIAGKAPWDDGYRRVNSSERYNADHEAFARWLVSGSAWEDIQRACDAVYREDRECSLRQL